MYMKNFFAKKANELYPNMTTKVLENTDEEILIHIPIIKSHASDDFNKVFFIDHQKQNCLKRKISN